MPPICAKDAHNEVFPHLTRIISNPSKPQMPSTRQSSSSADRQTPLPSSQVLAYDNAPLDAPLDAPLNIPLDTSLGGQHPFDSTDIDPKTDRVLLRAYAQVGMGSQVRRIITALSGLGPTVSTYRSRSAPQERARQTAASSAAIMWPR